MKVTFTVTESPFGRLLLAATMQGVCSVMIGDSETDLINHLRDRFPMAQIERDDAHLRLQVKKLFDYLNGQVPHADLPLDVQGTAFQMRVWEELRRIPRGQRISYGELARRIDKPKAIRAVARACATNPVAIITPCHRVVGKNGDMTGYRWGIETKRLLLEKETA